MFKKQVSSMFAGTLLALSSSAFATTIHFTQYTLDYTDAPAVVATSFFGGGGGSVGFGFKLLPSLNVLNPGTGIVSTAFALPTFTVTPAAGYALSGEILGSIGNLLSTLEIHVKHAVGVSRELARFVSRRAPGRGLAQCGVQRLERRIALGVVTEVSHDLLRFRKPSGDIAGPGCAQPGSEHQDDRNQQRARGGRTRGVQW